MRIKPFLGLALMLCIGTTSAMAAPERYSFDPFHTTIAWQANHFGFSNPSGKFTKADGVLILDEKDPTKSAVNITITIASLSTGLEKFDEHLQSKDFLNKDMFPSAKFVSKNVTVTGENKADVAGDLTLHGITKPVTLHVVLNKIGPNPMSQKKIAGFSATTTIKRSEFGINYAVPGVSDDVNIMIEAETILADATVNTNK